MILFEADLPELKPFVKSDCAWDKKHSLWDGRTWELTSNMYIRFANGRVGFELVIPEGFTTDGGSVPRIAWSAVNPMGKSLAAFIVHDALYSGELLSKADCDNVMRDIQKWLGESYMKRQACYRAVKWFGWTVWNKHDKNLVKAYKKKMTIKIV